MKAAFIICFLGNLVSPVLALSPEQALSQKEGLEKWSRFADQAKNEPSEQTFKKLGEGLRKTSRPEMYSIEGTREVHDKLQESMISIPGHAEYYAKKIELGRIPVAEEEKNNKHSPEEHYFLQSWYTYDDDRKYAFQVLRQLPSPETVRVICGMLEDERDHQDTSDPAWLGNDGKRTFGSNAEAAAGALSYFRVAGKGETRPDGKPLYRPPEFWRAWYAKLKAGTLTYHFPGDPTEYDLNGPASAQKLQQIALADKRDAERAAGHKLESPEATTLTGEASSSSSFSIASILAVVMAAVGGVWYFLKKKRAAV